MRAVDRYRAWALRGPFLLHHDNGTLQVDWPSPDTLLAHDPSSHRSVRIVRLAGDTADQLVGLVSSDDTAVLDLIVDDLAAYFGCTRARHLSGLIDRYCDPIADDLHQVYGLDLGDLFRGVMLPDEVMARIDGLPRHSRLSEALAQDDELAALSDDGEQSGTRAPEVRLTEWTPEAEGIATVADRLGDILAAISAFGGGHINVPLQPRPTSAHARLRERKEHLEYEELNADVEAAQARWRELNPTTEEG